MKLIRELSPWARSALSCRKRWCLSLQEQVCASKAPSTVGLTFPRYSSSDLPSHKGGMFSGPLLEAVLVYAGFVTAVGPGADPPVSLVDPLVECTGESGSATMGSSAPCNSGSRVELGPRTALEVRMHLSKALSSCGQSRWPCKRNLLSLCKDFGLWGCVC